MEFYPFEIYEKIEKNIYISPFSRKLRPESKKLHEWVKCVFFTSKVYTVGKFKNNRSKFETLSWNVLGNFKGIENLFPYLVSIHKWLIILYQPYIYYYYDLIIFLILIIIKPFFVLIKLIWKPFHFPPIITTSLRRRLLQAFRQLSASNRHLF